MYHIIRKNPDIINKKKMSNEILTMKHKAALTTILLFAPILLIMGTQWFTENTGFFWNQLLLSWISPFLVVYLLYHPIMYMYQSEMMETLHLNQDTKPCINSCGKLLCFGSKHRLWFIWIPCILCLILLEIFVSVNHLEEKGYTSFLAIFFSVCYYVCVWSFMLFINVFYLGQEYTIYPQLNLKNPCLTSAYQRDTHRVSYHFIFALTCLFMLMVIHITTMWWYFYTPFDSKIFIVLYVAIMIGSFYIIGTYYYDKKQDTFSPVHGLVCYMIALLITFMSCGLFSISYDYYLNQSASNEIFVLYGVFLLTSQIFYYAHDLAIKQMGCSFLHKHYIYPYLFWNYSCQFVILGFASANWQLIVLSVVMLLHNILKAFNVYSVIWSYLTCESVVQIDVDVNHQQKQRNANLFENMVKILSEQQILLQEFIATIHTMITFSILVYWFRFTQTNTNFTKHFILDETQFGVSICIQLFFRLITWFVTRYIIKIRLSSLIRLENSRDCILEDQSRPLVCLLTNYIQYTLGYQKDSKWFNFFYQQFFLDHHELNKTVITCDHDVTAQDLLHAKSMFSVIKDHWVFFTVTSIVLYTWLLLNHLSCPFRYMNFDLLVSDTPISLLCYSI
jgi:hypothetical protein